VTCTIIIDSREHFKEQIKERIDQFGGISCMITCLPHGADYMIIGEHGSVSIQRKSGSAEIPKQMEALRNDILPALKELTENPILLIEEDFVISSGQIYVRFEGMLKPTGLNVHAYFNFIHSCKLNGVDVITTRNLDASIEWMIATALYLDQEHYPKMKKQHDVSKQAIGALCCANGIGPSKAEKILQEKSLQELCTMQTGELLKVMTLTQVGSFERMRGAKCQPKK
jgi:ERCC4-type nuclease